MRVGARRRSRNSNALASLPRWMICAPFAVVRGRSLATYAAIPAALARRMAHVIASDRRTFLRFRTASQRRTARER
jgi:hypothetical protein